MKDYYYNHKSLPVFLAVIYGLHAIFSIGIKFLYTVLGEPGSAAKTFESIFCAVIFLAVPAIIFLVSIKSSRENAKLAMCSAFASKLLAIAAYVISMLKTSDSRLFAFVFCLSLGAAILEILFFAIIAYTLSEYRTEKICAVLSSVFSLFYHAANLIQLYAGIKLIGSGNFIRWSRILITASTSQLFFSLVRGAACALLFIFIYLGSVQNKDQSNIV